MDDIYTGNLLRSLPEVLRKDPDMLAFCTAFAEQMQITANLISRCIVYARINELPEDILDVLAYDFKVDWWDKSLTLSEKRATLKASWAVHRLLGTAAAVERALGAIYPDTVVDEWFDYAGDPYHFKLKIPVDYTALDLTKHAKVLSLVAFYKNLRSLLDEVEYFGAGGAATAYSAVAFTGCELIHSATAHNY